jgi:hypothetical protein
LALADKAVVNGSSLLSIVLVARWRTALAA